MKTIPRLLSAPPPRVDQDALDVFTSEGAPSAEPRLRLLACPAQRDEPQRFRMPLWPTLGKPK